MRLKAASDLYVSAYLYTAAFFSPKQATHAGSSLDASKMPLTEHVWKAAGGNDISPVCARFAGKHPKRLELFTGI